MSLPLHFMSLASVVHFNPELQLAGFLFFVIWIYLEECIVI